MRTPLMAFEGVRTRDWLKNLALLISVAFNFSLTPAVARPQLSTVTVCDGGQPPSLRRYVRSKADAMASLI